MTAFVLDVICDNGYEFTTDPVDSREEAEGLRDAMHYGADDAVIEIRELELEEAEE